MDNEPLSVGQNRYFDRDSLGRFVVLLAGEVKLLSRRWSFLIGRVVCLTMRAMAVKRCAEREGRCKRIIYLLLYSREVSAWWGVRPCGCEYVRITSSDRSCFRGIILSTKVIVFFVLYSSARHERTETTPNPWYRDAVSRISEPYSKLHQYKSDQIARNKTRKSIFRQANTWVKSILSDCAVRLWVRFISTTCNGVWDSVLYLLDLWRRVQEGVV